MQLPSPQTPLLFYGCGNMGRALLDGWLRGGLAPECFAVIDPFASDLPTGVAHYTDAQEAGARYHIAVLAIKPQAFGELATSVESVLTGNATVFSVLAGTRIATLQRALPRRMILRLMPNLAAALGKSPLGLFADNVSADSRSRIESLLAPLGQSCWLDAEEQMDAVTALAGSGPAFVYRFLSALTKAGEDIGLSAEQATQLSLAMVSGATALAEGSEVDPDALAARVTSKGGTTAAGLAILDQDDALRTLIANTLRAARDRGVELAAESE
jgi:pyrroline-5-carboxylate reductase